MIDNIKAEAGIDIPQQVRDRIKDKFLWNGLTMVPVFSTREPYGVIKYAAMVDNMRFIIKNDKLKIENSLHKFHHGNNYSDFTYSELNTAIERIEMLTGLNAQDFFFTKLEFGLNLQMEMPALNFLPSVKSYKKKNGFENMTDKGKLYGRDCELTEYRIKLYDKKEQVRIDCGIDIINTLRYEMVYTSKRKIPGVKTLNDLRNPKKIQVLFKDSMSVFKGILITGVEDFTDVSDKHIQLYFAGINPDYWEYLTKHSKDKGKERRELFAEIQGRVIRSSIKDQIEVSLSNKFNQCLGE